MCKCSGKCGCNITSTTKGEKGDASPEATLGYKVYTALLTQEGSVAPTSKILHNTLGGTPIFAYVSAGTYTLTLTGAFINNKTWFSSNPTIGLDVIQITRDSDNTISIVVRDTQTGTPINDELSDTPIEIRVYN